MKLRALLWMWVLVMAFFPSFSQIVYTTDGVELGEREELISLCASGIGSEKIASDGMTFSSHSICSCLIDEIITKLSSDDLMQLAVMNESELGNLMEMLTMAHASELIDCISVSVEEIELSVGSGETTGLREAAVNLCVQAMGTPRELAEAGVTRQQANDFCSCAVDKMVNNGYSYTQLMNIEDENDVVFNEVMMQCIGELVDVSQLTSNTYNPADIRGGGVSCRIPLLNLVANKIKLSICGVEKYFLFDTGASELVISNDLADQLWEQGCISEANILGETEFELADGTVIDGTYVLLNNITIGEYTVNNVVAAVIDDGGMLCGLGLLKKFKSWEIKDGTTLILYK